MYRLLGEDGREILENSDDAHALEVARNVNANTGETLTLVPFKHIGDAEAGTGEWVPDEDNATTFPGGEPADAAKRPAAHRKSAKK
jgi:hypothetical protein